MSWLWHRHGLAEGDPDDFSSPFVLSGKYLVGNRRETVVSHEAAWLA
jgi:hypothetical protein